MPADPIPTGLPSYADRATALAAINAKDTAAGIILTAATTKEQLVRSKIASNVSASDLSGDYSDLNVHFAKIKQFLRGAVLDYTKFKQLPEQLPEQAAVPGPLPTPTPNPPVPLSNADDALSGLIAKAVTCGRLVIGIDTLTSSFSATDKSTLNTAKLAAVTGAVNTNYTTVAMDDQAETLGYMLKAQEIIKAVNLMSFNALGLDSTKLQGLLADANTYIAAGESWLATMFDTTKSDAERTRCRRFGF
jgi:hypothetical protein